MTKIISVINHKGGVGKTTSSVNIGAALNMQKKKVLLIDIDPQANLTIHMGLTPSDDNNIYTALKEGHDLVIHPVKKGLDVVTSTLDLSAAETELSSEAGREVLLKQLVEPIKNRYDYILIDCPPSLGLLTLNALTTSDSIIIPIEPSNFAIRGMGKLFLIIGKVQKRLNSGLDTGKLLITKVDNRKVLHKDMVSQLREAYVNRVFDTQIRSNVSLEEAQMQEQDIFEYSPKSSGAEDYLNVSKEILKLK